MTYQEIESLAKSLSYRDKFHLAQTMLQMARKEEEEQNSSVAKFAAEFPNIVERILKSKPVKRKSLSSFIKEMFNFRGGISDDEINGVINQLQKQKVISIAIHGSRFTVARAKEDFLFVLTVCFSGVLRIERGGYSPFRIH